MKTGTATPSSCRTVSLMRSPAAISKFTRRKKVAAERMAGGKRTRTMMTRNASVSASSVSAGAMTMTTNGKTRNVTITTTTMTGDDGATGNKAAEDGVVGRTVEVAVVNAIESEKKEMNRH